MPKIQLNIVLENADSKETMDLECSYEGSASGIEGLAADLDTADSTAAILQGLHKALTPETMMYRHFLDVFTRMGHDKLGWHDVMAYITAIEIDGTVHSIDEDYLYDNDLQDMNRIQIARGTACGSCSHYTEASMYFLN